MTNLGSYFKLLRIRGWIAFFLMTLFGFMISDWFLYPAIDTGILFLILLLFLGFSFSINDCFDVKEDKSSKKKNPIARGKISFRRALLFSISLGLLSLLLSTHYGLKVFLFYFLLIFLSFFYSSPPLRFKSKILLDILSHGLFFGSFLFLLPLIIFGSNLGLFQYSIAFSIFWFSVIIELKNHLRDFEGDKKAGLKTTVCILGKQKSETLLKLLEVSYPATLLPIFLFCQDFLLSSLFTLVFCLFLVEENYKLSKYLRLPYNLLQRFIALLLRVSKSVFS